MRVTVHFARHCAQRHQHRRQRFTSAVVRPRRHASMAIAGARSQAPPSNGRPHHDARSEAKVKARSIRIWSRVHRWTSLVSTIFLLLLCLTGLPLIFHHEIDELLDYAPKPHAAVAGAQRATVDRIAKAALASDPGKVLQYIAWDIDAPGIVTSPTPTVRLTENPMTRSSALSTRLRLTCLDRSAPGRCSWC